MSKGFIQYNENVVLNRKQTHLVQCRQWDGIHALKIACVIIIINSNNSRCQSKGGASTHTVKAFIDESRDVASSTVWILDKPFLRLHLSFFYD